MTRLGLLWVFLGLLAAGHVEGAPYPRSAVIGGMNWDLASTRFAGDGGDIWPITWAADGSLRGAYGDGQIGCAAKVSYGMVTISTSPPALGLAPVACGPSGTGKGKLMALGAAGSALFARLAPQTTGTGYPILRSTDGGRSWTKGWSPLFATDAFVQFGRGNAGAPGGYVYLVSVTGGSQVQLTRFPPDRWNVSSAYQYFSGTATAPAWSSSLGARKPIFVDHAGVRRPSIHYVPGLKRYLLTAAHSGPGEIGVFDAPNPWGPWTTGYYASNWLGLASKGGFYSLYFPQKWQSADGRTLWATFNCHDEGQTGACGKYHDRLTMLKVTLQ